MATLDIPILAMIINKTKHRHIVNLILPMYVARQWNISAHFATFPYDQVATEHKRAILH